MYYDFSKKTTKKPKPKVKEPPLDKKGKLYCLAAVIILIISILGGFGVAKLIQLSNPEPEPDEPPLSQDQIENTLTTAFLKSESNKQNLVYSPLSIKNGLALLQAGAAGNTKAQIDSILGDVVILKKTANIEDKISLANAVFIRESFKDHMSSDYVKKVKESYGAEIVYDNFSSSATMENWVKQNTLGLIDKIGLVPQNNAKMVLVNALAIKLDWVHQFDSVDTKGLPFTNVNGEEIIATTMYQKTNNADVRYYQDNAITLLSLPLEKAGDAELEFVAIMPKNDLEGYIKTFDQEVLSLDLDAMSSASTQKNGIEIMVPKFRFDYELKFKDDLMGLGVTDAFNITTADFSAVAGEPLYVSDAIHKTNINLSEDGIEASSVTASMINAGSALAPLTPKTTIKLDHPFLFVIRDKNNGAVWFIGTVYQPNLWADDVDYYIQ